MTSENNAKKVIVNRKCEDCGGYELDNGVDDVCDCEEERDDDWFFDPDRDW